MNKQANIYLYVAIVFFLGIVAIFLFKGYMGVYETLYINSGEYEQKIEADFWQAQPRGVQPPEWSTGVQEDGKVIFRYQIENRQLTQYSTYFEVSVMRSQVKVLDLVNREIIIEPFSQSEVNWELDTAALQLPELQPGQVANYSVVIKRGDVQRRIILYINSRPFPVIKPPMPIPAQ